MGKKSHIQIIGSIKDLDDIIIVNGKKTDILNLYIQYNSVGGLYSKVITNYRSRISKEIIDFFTIYYFHGKDKRDRYLEAFKNYKEEKKRREEKCEKNFENILAKTSNGLYLWQKRLSVKNSVSMQQVYVAKSSEGELRFEIFGKSEDGKKFKTHSELTLNGRNIDFIDSKNILYNSIIKNVERQNQTRTEKKLLISK